MGNWSDEQKRSYLVMCKQGAAGNTRLPPEKLDDYCQCMLRRLSGKYSSPEEAMKRVTPRDISELSEECVKEVTRW